MQMAVLYSVGGEGIRSNSPPGINHALYYKHSQLRLPSFHTLLHNSRVEFFRAWCNCPNKLITGVQWCHIAAFNVGFVLAFYIFLFTYY